MSIEDSAGLKYWKLLFWALWLWAKVLGGPCALGTVAMD